MIINGNLFFDENLRNNLLPCVDVYRLVESCYFPLFYIVQHDLAAASPSERISNSLKYKQALAPSTSYFLPLPHVSLNFAHAHESLQLAYGYKSSCCGLVVLLRFYRCLNEIRLWRCAEAVHLQLLNDSSKATSEAAGELPDAS